MTVLVYGATGYTGELCVRALCRRGVPVVLAGRSQGRLGELAEAVAAHGGLVEIRVAELYDPADLAAALAGITLVVSCAGPFSQLGEAVLRAALTAGAHYIDTTGEQSFMRDMFQRYDAAARRADLCVVNALGFEVALGDWAAALAGSAIATADAPADEIAIAYAVDGCRGTRGTVLSALAALTEPACVWQDDRWDPATPGSETRPFGFPAPFGARRASSFPSGEVITVPRHVPTRRVQTYLHMTESPLPGALASLASWWLRGLAPALPALLRSPLGERARRRIREGPPGPTPGQRAVTDFAVVAQASRGFAESRVAVAGTDPYGATAEIVALGVAAFAAGAVTARGVCPPAKVLDAEAALAALANTIDLRMERS
jgi:short subunit dehydrogenase-like uncharacterized protein